LRGGQEVGRLAERRRLPRLIVVKLSDNGQQGGWFPPTNRRLGNPSEQSVIVLLGVAVRNWAWDKSV